MEKIIYVTIILITILLDGVQILPNFAMTLVLGVISIIAGIRIYFFKKYNLLTYIDDSSKVTENNLPMIKKIFILLLSLEVFCLGYTLYLIFLY